jgi:hypothetical protein
MRATSLMTAALLALAAAGCGDDTTGTVFQVPTTGGSGPRGIVTGGGISVTVGSGTTPTYSWTGGPARSLAVRSSTGETMWQIESIDLNAGFASPVQHGVAPSSARVVSQPRALAPGVLHTATVTVVTGGSGTRSFTPQSLSAP